MKLNNVTKWVILYSLVAWGFVSFLLVIDEDLNNRLTPTIFFFEKLCGTVSYIGAGITALYAASKGYIPSKEDIDNVFGKD